MILHNIVTQDPLQSKDNSQAGQRVAAEVDGRSLGNLDGQDISMPERWKVDEGEAPRRA